MPPTTVSVTVAHADYNELTRDVVMQKGGLIFFTFDLQRIHFRGSNPTVGATPRA